MVRPFVWSLIYSFDSIQFRAWPERWENRVLLLACSSLLLEMLVATYVHLQPGVPAAVLPLGIKPPVIPLFVVLLDVIVALPAWKNSQIAHAAGARNVVASSSGPNGSFSR